MIHAHLFRRGIPQTNYHGEEFLRIMHQINQRAGLSITVSIFTILLREKPQIKL